MKHIEELAEHIEELAEHIADKTTEHYSYLMAVEEETLDDTEITELRKYFVTYGKEEEDRMRFKEAIELIEEGKKLTRKSWNTGDYIYGDLEGDLMNDGGGCHYLTTSELLADDWEEWKEVNLEELIKIMERHVDLEENTENRNDYELVLKYLKESAE